MDAYVHILLELFSSINELFNSKTRMAIPESTEEVRLSILFRLISKIGT
jgi:hypothetical protein